MAKQIEGVYENVLRCARQEFLEKGFALASLRDIAKAAGTSTGSIYTRFTDKAGLFRGPGGACCRRTEAPFFGDSGVFSPV